MKQLLTLILIFLCTVLPKAVLAIECAESFYPSPSVDTMLERIANNKPVSNADINNLRIERLADQNYWLSREEAFTFARSAEQMGFTAENIISMLNSKNFMNFLLHNSFLTKKQLQELLKISGQNLAIPEQKTSYGLFALSSVFQFSNSQIMKLAEINNMHFFKPSILRNQQLLENLGFSREEIFEFIVKYIEGKRTPFQFSPSVLKEATPLLSEMGLDHAAIRQILTASVLELWASKQLKPSFSALDNERYSHLTVEEKKAILREHGLSDAVIDLIPQEMFEVSKRKLGEIGGIYASFALWIGFFYWLFS